jgi:hypothetical protein
MKLATIQDGKPRTQSRTRYLRNAEPNLGVTNFTNQKPWLNGLMDPHYTGHKFVQSCNFGAAKINVTAVAYLGVRWKNKKREKQASLSRRWLSSSSCLTAKSTNKCLKSKNGTCTGFNKQEASL